MKFYILAMLAATSALDYALDGFSLRKGGTTLSDIDVAVEIGTPPDAYSKLVSDDKRASGRLNELVTIIKRMMNVGFEPILPVLDPLRRKSLGPYDVKNKLVSGVVTLRNVVISGLKSMNVKDLVLRLNYDGQLRLDIIATIPSLTFEADLETNVKLKKIVPLKAKGGITVQIKKLKVTAALGSTPVGMKRKLKRKLKGKKVKGSSKVMNVDSIHGNGRAESAEVTLDFPTATRKIIETTGGVKMIYKYGKDEMGASIGKSIIKEINAVLNEISLAQIRAYLLGKD